MSTIIGKTSDTEFNLQRRVQKTNEIPNYDLFKRIHNCIQDSLWSWFLGYQKLTRDLPKDINGQTGELSPEAFGKMVNGVFAENYGPTPYLVWNEKDKEYKEITPNYHRMEVNGALLPEFDLFMHEIYRYLGRLYPDHPDFADLLTNKELNDILKNVASFIDHDINFQIFEFINSTDIEGVEFDEKEALKSKIRELLANTYRRKFYGSNFGFRALCSSIGYWGEMYPVLTYYPLQKVTQTFDEVETDKFKVDFNKDELRKVNVANSLLGNKVRLIDYPREYTSPIPLSQESEDYQFITFPGYEFFGFNTLPELNQELLPTFIQAQQTKDLDIDDPLKFSTGYELSIPRSKSEFFPLEDSFAKVASATNYSAVQLSNKLKTHYLKNYTYGTYLDLINKINSLEDQAKELFLKELEEAQSKYLFDGELNLTSKQATSYFGDTYKILSKFDTALKPKEISVLPDLFDEGRIILSLDEMSKIYPQEVVYHDVPSSEGISANLEAHAGLSKNLPLELNTFIGNSDIIQEDISDLSLIYKVINYHKGFFDIICDKFKSDLLRKTDVYGVVIQIDPTKTFFVQGSIEVLSSEEFSEKVTFKLSAIPQLIPQDIVEVLNLSNNNNTPFYTEDLSAQFGIDTKLKIFQVFKDNDTKEFEWFEFKSLSNCAITNISFGALDTISIFEFNQFKNTPWLGYETGILESKNLGFDTASFFVDFTKEFSDKLATSNVSKLINNQSIYTLNLAASEKETSLYWQNQQYYDEHFFGEFSFSDEFPLKTLVTFNKNDPRVRGVTLGSQILCNNLPRGTYLERITDSDEFVLSNKAFNEGAYEFIVLNKYNLSPKDIDKDFKIDSKLIAQELKDKESVFDQGLYTSTEFPYASQIKPKSVPNPGDYQPYTKTFNNVVSYLYRSTSELTEKINVDTDMTAYESYTQPSAMINERDVFLEIVADKLLSKSTKNGVTPSLMTADLLSFLDSSIHETVQTCENANVGVQLSMETDTSGYYTFDLESDFTDPKILLKFQTYHWEEDTIPAYIEVGTGKNNDIFLKPGENLMKDMYGTALYNQGASEQELLDFESENNGTVKNFSMYGSKDNDLEEDKKILANKTMQLDLGEHNIVLNYEKDSQNKYTIVNFSIIKKDISKNTAFENDTLKATDKNYLNPQELFIKGKNNTNNLELNYVGKASNSSDLSTIGLDQTKFNYWLATENFIFKDKNGFNRNPTKNSIIVFKDGILKVLNNQLGLLLTSFLWGEDTVLTTENITSQLLLLQNFYEIEDINSLEAAFSKNVLNQNSIYWIHNIQKFAKEEDNLYSGNTNIILNWDDKIYHLDVVPSIYTDSILFEKPEGLPQNQFNILFSEAEIFDTPINRIKTNSCSFEIDSTLARKSLKLEAQISLPFLSQGEIINFDDEGNLLPATASINPEYFNIAYSDFVYNEENDFFYVKSPKYSKQDDGSYSISSELYNFKVLFQSPTYFKNLGKLDGQYKKQKSLNNNLEQVDTYFLDKIEGIPFNYELVSFDDLILKAREISIRYPLSQEVESIGFNNYVKVDLPIQSVNTTKGLITLGASFDQNYLLDSTKNRIVVNKLFKKETSGLTETGLEYIPTDFVLGTPLSKLLSNSTSATQDLIYFKNYLTFGAKISKDDPTKIIPQNKSLFDKVLSKITKGDILKNIKSTLPISTGKLDGKFVVNVGGTLEDLVLSQAKFLNNIIIGWNDDSLYYTNNSFELQSENAIELKKLVSIEDPATVKVSTFSDKTFIQVDGKIYEFDSLQDTELNLEFVPDYVDIKEDTSDNASFLVGNTTDDLIFESNTSNKFTSLGKEISVFKETEGKWFNASFPEDEDTSYLFIESADSQEKGTYATTYFNLALNRLKEIKTLEVENAKQITNIDVTLVTKLITLLETESKKKLFAWEAFEKSTSIVHDTTAETYSITLSLAMKEISSIKQIFQANKTITESSKIALYHSYIYEILKLSGEVIKDSFYTDFDKIFIGEDNKIKFITPTQDILVFDLNNISEASDISSSASWSTVLIESLGGKDNDEQLPLSATRVTKDAMQSYEFAEGESTKVAFVGPLYENKNLYEVTGFTSKTFTQGSLGFIYGTFDNKETVQADLDSTGFSEDSVSAFTHNSDFQSPMLALSKDYNVLNSVIIDLKKIKTFDFNASVGKIDFLENKVRVYIINLDDQVAISTGCFEMNYLTSDDLLKADSFSWIEEDLDDFILCEEPQSSATQGYFLNNTHKLQIQGETGLNTTNLQISSYTDEYIKFNNSLVNSELSSDTLVYLQLKTIKSISAPHEFLEKADLQYITSFNKNTKADNYLSADYIYIKNEVEQVYNSSSYPSVEADTFRTFYEYDTNGDVLPLKNTFGEVIYLCNLKGEVMSDVEAYTLNTLVSLNIPPILKQAPKLKIKSMSEAVDSEVFLNNLDLTEEFLKDNTLKITDLNREFSQVGISSLNLDVLKDYCYTNSEINLLKDNIDLALTPIINSEDILLGDDGFLQDTDGNNFIKDIFVSYYVRCDSDQNNQIIQTNNFKIITQDNKLDSNTSGIYFNPQGYGGYQGKTSLDELPWISDPKAFKEDVLLNNLGEKVYLTDSKGKYLKDEANKIIECKVPLYPTHFDLVDKKGLVLDTYADIKSLDDLKIMSLDAASQRIYLEKSLYLEEDKCYEFIMLNKKDVVLETSDYNDPERIYKLSLQELNTYTPNRVYYPQELMTPFAVKAPGSHETFYYPNAKELYNKELYKISDLNYVCLCDEEGYFSVVKTATEANYEFERFSLEAPKDILISYKPKNSSLQEYFKEVFFVDNASCNPFYIFLDGKYNSTTQDLDFKVVEQVKNGLIQGFSEVNDLITLKKSFIFDGDNLDEKYLDWNTGNISIIFSFLKSNTTQVKYGILYQNPTLDGSEKDLEIFGSLQTEYSLFTTKNYDLPDSKNNQGTVEITELGLFNKEGSLIAYATFPPIEYNSENQHVSFNCFIRHGDNSV